MKGLKTGILVLVWILSWIQRPGVAQENGSGLEGFIIDSDGTLFDPQTGRRLTPEEVAAELERRARAAEEPPVPEEQPVSTEPLPGEEAEGSLPEREGMKEAGSFFPGMQGMGEESVGTQGREAIFPPAGQAPSPAPSAAPAPRQPAPRPGGGETQSRGGEETWDEEMLSNLASLESSGSEGTEAADQPPSPGQPSSSQLPLLPPNSPAARLLQDHRYALEEARLIVGPDGQWLTLQEAQKRRYREGDIRALLQAYREARQALQQGDRVQLRQALQAFMERLDRLNSAAGQALPGQGSRDLEALRKQLEAGVLAASTQPASLPLEAAEPGPRRSPWGLVAGLVALGLLGGGLAWRRWRRPGQKLTLPVKGQVMVVRGPDAGKVWEVDGERVLFGTSEECAVRLTDPSLSPVHVALTHEPDGFHVANLDPDFETWVNGRPITATLLQEGDVIEIGQTALAFEPAPG